jgi:hypothetical protein
MPAEMRQARRNYIDLVTDEREQNRLAPGRPPQERPLKDYLRRLAMSMLKTRDGAR